jgi:hypothetical protein
MGDEKKIDWEIVKRVHQRIIDRPPNQVVYEGYAAHDTTCCALLDLHERVEAISHYIDELVRKISDDYLTRFCEHDKVIEKLEERMKALEAAANTHTGPWEGRGIKGTGVVMIDNVPMFQGPWEELEDLKAKVARFAANLEKHHLAQEVGGDYTDALREVERELKACGLVKEFGWDACKVPIPPQVRYGDIKARVAQFVEWLRAAGGKRTIVNADVEAKLRELGLVEP